MWIPESHTSFSWGTQHDGPSLPVGHTRFSWFGAAWQAEDENTSRPAGVLRRGFLDTTSETGKIEDVQHFLSHVVERLLEKASSLSDLESEEISPYKYKYEARDILKKLHNQILGCDPCACSLQVQKQVEETRGRIELLLGINFYETEEVSQGHKFLTEAQTRLSAIALNSTDGRSHADYMACLNHLAIISSLRQDQHKALDLLLRAKEFHQQASKASPSSDLLCPVEKQLTTTCFLLAQVYQKLGDLHASAELCLQTLDRQARVFSDEDWKMQGDEWVKNAIQLSGYSLSMNDFGSASMCLGAAEVASKRCKEESAAENSASINWGWGKLFIAMLSSGREQLLENFQEERNVVFKRIDFHLEGVAAHVERRKGKKFPEEVRDYESACVVMRGIVNVLDKVKEFYVLDGFCTEHIMVLQDLSRSYKYLIDFCKNTDDICKLHKRRIDLLEPVARELNPRAFDWLAKELWYEIAEAYRSMLEMKSSQVERGEKRISRSKLRALGCQAIACYETFERLFDPVPGDGAGKGEVQGISDAQVRKWFFSALFGAARVHSKIPTGEGEEEEEGRDRRKHLAEALRIYQRIIKLWEEKPLPAESGFREELQICRDMIELLPAKIDRLHTLDEGRSGTL